MSSATQTITEPETTAYAQPETPRDLISFRHRITVAEYHHALEAGVFGPEPRVELLEGLVVEKMSKNPPHILATDLIQYLMSRLLPAGYFISMGNPVTIEARDGEPEPDASILRGQLRDYTGRTRTPADMALVIEVADSSYSYDRYQKSSTYAAAGIPIYWILDLNRRRLEVFTNPVSENADTPAYYAQTQIHASEDEVRMILDGREVAQFMVAEILP